MVTARKGGFTLMGFIFALVIVGFVAILGFKTVPSVTEYMAIRDAIESARNSGPAPRAIRAAFDHQRQSRYISSVEGKDLQIVTQGDRPEVSVAYEKRIELIGPVSLAIHYTASTDKRLAANKQ